MCRLLWWASIPNSTTPICLWVESLFHAGTANDAVVSIRWVDSEEVTADNAKEILAGCDGILVPGGFGDRGIEGMIAAAQYARTTDTPLFGHLPGNANCSH